MTCGSCKAPLAEHEQGHCTECAVREGRPAWGYKHPPCKTCYYGRSITGPTGHAIACPTCRPEAYAGELAELEKGISDE